jgi:hypothetical protein
MTIDAGGKVGIGNSSPLGKLTISNAAGSNAPTSVTAANTYLQLGSADHGTLHNGKFMIGFGYTDATNNTNSPAYIGYEEASTGGDTYGDLTFYTRSVYTDTAPTERMRITNDGAVTIADESIVANEILKVNGPQVVGTGAAGVYTISIAQVFAASASKYLRIQLDENLFGALTITATGDYSSVNAIGIFQKVYSVGINSSNTSIYSAGNTTTVDLGATSGQFSMGTPTKPNATTYYIPMANLNGSYPITMALVIEMKGYIEGITSVDIIAA